MAGGSSAESESNIPYPKKLLALMTMPKKVMNPKKIQILENSKS